jgi:hypothetical protein
MAFRHSDAVLDVPPEFEALFTSDGAVGWQYRADSPYLAAKIQRAGTGTKWSEDELGKDQRTRLSLNRGAIQGMKLKSNERILYSVQFHPEMDNFFAAHNDDGNGQAFLQEFFRVADSWWRQHSVYNGFQ